MRQFRKDTPIYVYYTRVDFESGHPSERVLNYINGVRCDDYRDDFDNVLDLLQLDGDSKVSTIVNAVPATPNFICNRGRKRKAPQIQNEADEEHTDSSDDEEIVRGRIEVRQYWDPVPCPNCGAMHLLSHFPATNKSRRNSCCSGGKFAAYSPTKSSDDLPSLQPLPPELLEIALGEIPYDQMELLVMNFKLDFAITAVHNPKKPQQRGFDPHCGGSIRLQGQVYHKLKGQNEPDSLGFFTTGGTSAIDRLAAFDKHGVDGLKEFMEPNTPVLATAVNEYDLRRFASMLLRENVLAHELKFIGDYMQTDLLDEEQPINTHVVKVKNKTSIFDVSANYRDFNTRTFNIYLKRWDDNIPNDVRQVDLENPYIEALCYPFLFPGGDKGWGRHHPIQIMDYIRYRLLQPEPFVKYDTENDVIDGGYLGHETTIEQPGNRAPFPLRMPSNRFNIFSILGQYWLVDLNSRAIEKRLNYQKSEHFQNRLRRGKAVDRQEANEIYVKKMALNIPGCLGHMRRKSRDLLELANQLGAVHIFCTLTTNIEWPEILEALPPGQTAFENPKIVCMVFKARLEAFLNNLRNRKYFDGRKVKYLSYVIEYQERALPHAHIVVAYDGMPEHNSEEMFDWIDEHITCRKPPVPRPDATPRDIKLHSIIGSKNIHKCGAYCAGPCGCKNGFDKTYPLERTKLDERGFPLYKRGINDLRVVSYNEQIALDWDGHTNVAFATSAHCIFYLFSYLYKGQKKAMQKLDLLEAQPGSAQSEAHKQFDEYISSRKTSSMSATWVALGYHTYPSPIPKVRTLWARDEEFYAFHNAQGSASDIAVYFDRIPDHAHYLFVEWYKRFSWSLKPPRNLASPNYIYDHDLTCGRRVYVTARPCSKGVVYMYKPTQHLGEHFYIRQLLKNVPTTSYRALRTHNNITYDTYQEAAIARGLVDNYIELTEIFNEFMVESHPAQLRITLAILTLQGYPTTKLLTEFHYKTALIQDYIDNGMDSPTAYNKFLIELQERLQDDGRTLSDYGLQGPRDTTTLLQRERLRHCHVEAMNNYNAMNVSMPSTDEQQFFLDAVHQALSTQSEGSPPIIFVLQGSGGTGKSITLKKVMARARSIDKLVLGCAATGVAASQHDDFTTAHSLFDLPVIGAAERELDNEFTYRSGLQKNKQKMELLMDADMLVWDEIFSNTKECLDALPPVLDGLNGKVMVLVGDIKQILGIPTESSHECLLESLIVESKLFKNARLFELTQNMRMLRSTEFTEDQRGAFESYLQTVECIGLGKTDQRNVFIGNEPTYLRDNHQLIIKPIPFVMTTRETISHLYPDGFSTQAAQGAMILTTTNAKVAEWNAVIQALNPEAAQVLFSKNTFADHDDEHGHLQKMLTEQNMVNADRPDGPPHILKLKKGDICFLTMSLARREKLCKNRLVQILDFRPRSVKVLLLNGIHSVHFIPRVRTRLAFNNALDMAFTRTQFPLRLAYSCTHNKSQSQTLQRVVIDITHDLFAHGHLYVALTRVIHPDYVRFYVSEKELTDLPGTDLDKCVKVNNIVHKHIVKKVCPRAFS